MQSEKVKYSIKYKLILLSLAAGVPFLVMSLYLVYALHSYSSAYDAIVENLTVANNYNLNFKEEMDESLYKLVVGAVTFDTVGSDGSLADPYVLLDELREEFNNLMSITMDGDSRVRLQILLRNIDTLEDRVDDIRMNLETDVGYDTNIVMLENNIYILTELIQDNIQYYIYYQTKSMEHLTSQLNVRVHSFTLFCGGMLAALILMVAVLIVMIVTDITSPIKVLSKVTQQVAKGDFSARARVESQDEVAVLAESVNSMTESLEGLVSKIKEDERKMRKADLRNDSDKAVNMVMSLSEFFRLVLSKGKEYITIQEEELHIKSYLEIQQVRYRDILEYEIEIDSELYRYQILKLTLQPLVENSLYHGIKYKRAKGRILVTGRLCGDEVHFTVEDNGVGMEEEELRKLQEEIKKPCKDTEKGFGLANVNERIRMNFGAEYGMRIDSIKGKGTRVEIVIPAVPYTVEREG